MVAMSMPPPPEHFTANRPFVILLRARETILFAGKIQNPTQTS